MTRAPFWLVVGLAYTLAALVLVVAGIPSPYLFAGVTSGAVCAVVRADRRPFPDRIRPLTLGIIGVGAGSVVTQDALKVTAGRPMVVLGGVLGTLLVSMLVGQVLRLSRHISPTTAMLSSIAGGASGVSAVARELNADEDIVLSIQYLRVLLVLATVPVMSTALGATASHADPALTGAPRPDTVLVPFTALAVGLLLAKACPFSAASLILPMLVAGSLSITGVPGSGPVPSAALNAAYGAIGLMVGLAFTPGTLRRLAALMPLALLQSVLSVGACVVVGLVVARAANLSKLDGYLATSPGGLPAITAVAIASGANIGLVLTMQVLRVVAALMLASTVAAAARRRRLGRAPGTEPA